MTVFTHEQVIEAVSVLTENPNFPLPEDAGTARLLDETVNPALDSLPSHLNCEMVRVALKAMFVMGLTVADEIHAS